MTALSATSCGESGNKEKEKKNQSCFCLAPIPNAYRNSIDSYKMHKFLVNATKRITKHEKKKQQLELTRGTKQKKNIITITTKTTIDFCGRHETHAAQNEKKKMGKN